MKLAWFRATRLDEASSLDDTAPLVAVLQSTHDIEVFTSADAHDFVWKHFRAAYDVCVFELNNTRTHAFVWPYLLQYTGVVLLRSLTLHDSRAHALAREGRLEDYAAEFSFNEGHWPRQTRALQSVPRGNWPMLRVPLMAARIAVVPHQAVAAALQDEYPEARMRYAPIGVSKVQEVPSVPKVQGSPTTFGLISSDRVDVARRALARAQEGGAPATLMIDVSAERVLQAADVIVALQWPSSREGHVLALTAMAAGKPVVVLETVSTADWPALDPQTWRPRGSAAVAPIAVSIDLRDEEHSLAVAIRRLSTDATLRTQLGSAAHAWWREHATLGHAREEWNRILTEAVALDPPRRPADWPAHLNADGTERARAILEECGATVDLFGESPESRGTGSSR